jgi:hypothetical protein
MGDSKISEETKDNAFDAYALIPASRRVFRAARANEWAPTAPKWAIAPSDM